MVCSLIIQKRNKDDYNEALFSIGITLINILILPTSYPNIYNKNASIFVEDQAVALSKHKNLHVSVIGAVPVSLKEIWKKRLFKFGVFQYQKNKVNIELFLFPSIPKLRRVNNFIRYLLNKWLLKKNMQNKIDIVHVHNSVAAEAALWLQEKNNIPYCITEHSSAYARDLLTLHEIKKYAKIYKNSIYNIAVSPDLCKRLHYMFDVPFTFIPNIVDTEFFIPSENRYKNFRFITVANLNKNKNILLLVRAFSKVFYNNTDVSLLILGDGSEYKTLQTEVEKLHMQNQITLYGFATRDEVLHELKQSHAFVLSSHYETFGVVLIEAMSCGLPVISTRSGGPESIIENNQLGLLVENNNIEELAKAMLKVYNTVFDTEYIRNYTIEKFSENTVVTKLYKVYNDIVTKEGDAGLYEN